jgi:hypothetical protein
MPAARSVTMTGVAETIRSIRGLMREDVQRQISRELDAVAQPIMVQAKANVMTQDAIRTGGLFDSIVTVPKINPNKGTISVIIGPKKQRAVANAVTGKTRRRAAVYKFGSKQALPAKYAHLVEFGTKPHAYQMRTRKGIESFMHPGTRAKPFLGPAFDAASPGMVGEIGAAAGRIVEKQAKALASAGK